MALLLCTRKYCVEPAVNQKKGGYCASHRAAHQLAVQHGKEQHGNSMARNMGNGRRARAEQAELRAQASELKQLRGFAEMNKELYEAYLELGQESERAGGGARGGGGAGAWTGQGQESE
jgi:hypothetical protein